MSSATLSLKVSNPARIPILYVILGVLVAISVVPMYFYSAQVESINRDRLKTNEMLLQNTVTRSLADDISQHEGSLRMMLANLSSAIQVASGGDISAAHVARPELRALRLLRGDTLWRLHERTRAEAEFAASVAGATDEVAALIERAPARTPGSPIDAEILHEVLHSLAALG